MAFHIAFCRGEVLLSVLWLVMAVVSCASAPWPSGCVCIPAPALLARPSNIVLKCFLSLALSGCRCHRPSQAGIVHEMQLCMERSSSQRLHFSYVQDVQAPVRVFAGTADTVQAFQHVKEWAESAAHRNVELIPVEGGTHDGIMHTHKVKALQALAADLGR